MSIQLVLDTPQETDKNLTVYYYFIKIMVKDFPIPTRQ